MGKVGRLPRHETPARCRRRFRDECRRDCSDTRRGPRSAAATACRSTDAGCPQGLQAGYCRATSQARRSGLADDPPHLRRMGLQSAVRHYAGERSAIEAGVGVLDRRSASASGRTARQRRRDVRHESEQSGHRDRCEERKPALALSTAARDRHERSASDQPRRGALWRQGVLRCG